MIDFGTEITEAKPIPRHEMFLEAWAWGFNTIKEFENAMDKAYKKFDFCIDEGCPNHGTLHICRNPRV